jgi:hypothetical protein
MTMETLNYTEDRKHLGTVHTPSSIEEYYHVRRKYENKTTFRFVVVNNTKTGVKEYEITEKQIPKDINIL